MIRHEALISVLTEMLKHYPHWRFGQLVANVAEWADQSTWDIEDEQWIAAARSHLDQIAARDQVVR